MKVSFCGNELFVLNDWNISICGLYIFILQLFIYNIISYFIIIVKAMNHCAPESCLLTASESIAAKSCMVNRFYIVVQI